MHNWLIEAFYVSFLMISYDVSEFCMFGLNIPQIFDLFEWLVQPCLDFIDRECRFVIHTSPIHLTNSLLKLYTCLLG